MATKEVVFDYRAKCRLSPEWAADEIARLRMERTALRAERDRLATDLGVRASLLEQVSDGLVAPTREAIQARHDEMYEELRKNAAR